VGSGESGNVELLTLTLSFHATGSDITDDLNPHKTEDSSLRYLPDRRYFTALLDIRGFLQ
jgi:hypothetical protein